MIVFRLDSSVYIVICQSLTAVPARDGFPLTSGRSNTQAFLSGRWFHRFFITLFIYLMLLAEI